MFSCRKVTRTSPFYSRAPLRGLAGKRVPLAEAFGDKAHEWARRMAERFVERPAQATIAAERIVTVVQIAQDLGYFDQAHFTATVGRP